MVEPYWTDKEPDFALYCGDNRIMLPQLEAESIDSIVTDPPYELGFMGKGWDRSGIAYDVAMWRECLRVLKPGGHLLAFGGSRTYHRLACAVEDVGFEIRDQIQWIYSSGFPKSLNVSKNLREEGIVCTCNDQAEQKAQHALRSLPNADLSQTLSVDAPTREVLQSRLSEQGASEPWATRAQPETTGPQQPGVEGRRYGVQEEGQLHRSALCESAGVGEVDGPQGRLSYGASVGHGADVWVSSHQNGSSKPSGPQTVEQQALQLGAMADECGSQARGGWPLCSWCSKSILPEGIGSALKPAHEPIVLARKPFDSTLIQNVLHFGTGGINIDKCRVPTVETLSAGSRRLGDGIKFGFCEPRTEYEQNENGRWPSNLIHDGSEEVLSAFPEAPGQQGNLSGHSKDRLSKGIFGDMKAARDAVARLDSGSAARFFYCAKATQEDRNEGLDDLPVLSAGAVTDRKDGSAGLNSPRVGAGRTSGSRNHHPTVKPTDLMRYLCRLITPPKGLVLDPFCGSGSTGKAARAEGFRFIGIEINEEYCALARARCEIPQRSLWGE